MRRLQRVIEDWSIRQRLVATAVTIMVAVILMTVGVVLRLRDIIDSNWLTVNSLTSLLVFMFLLHVWYHFRLGRLIALASALMAAVGSLVMLVVANQIAESLLALQLFPTDREWFRLFLIIWFAYHVLPPVVASMILLMETASQALRRRTNRKLILEREQDRGWQVNLALFSCSTLPETSSAQRMLEIIERTGGTMLQATPSESDEGAFVPGPPAIELTDLVDEGGAINLAFVRHNLLEHPTTDCENLQSGIGFVFFYQRYMTHLQVGQYLQHDQSVDQSQEVNAIAEGLLAFVERLYPSCRPAYASVSMLEECLLSHSYKAVSRARLERIMWANLFGPDYVSRYGRDFLLNAPGWRVEELDDEGILYVVTESMTEFRMGNLDHVSNYFRSRYPYVELYRHHPRALFRRSLFSLRQEKDESM